MAFIGKSPRIMKSPRSVEPALKPKAISHAEGGIFFFEEDQKKPVHGDGTVGSNDLIRPDEKPGSLSGVFGRRIDDSFQ